LADWEDFEEVTDNTPAQQQGHNWEDFEEVKPEQPAPKQPIKPAAKTQSQPLPDEGEARVSADTQQPTTTLTGGVSHNVRTYWDKNGRIHYEDEDTQPKMNWFQRMGRKLQAGLTNANSWINETNPDSEAYKQKANTILTLETLPVGVGKTATQWGASKLTPFLGKKIAANVAEGAGAGLVGGGIYGGGNALIEGENPAVGTLEGAAAGLAGGAVLGGALGKGEQYLAGRALKKYKDFDSLSQTEKKQFRKDASQYYKNYLQGRNVNHSDVGQIDFTNAGLETVSKQPNAAKNFNSLRKDLKNAEYKTTEKPRENHPKKANYDSYIKLQDSNNEYVVVHDDNGNKYYLTKQMADDTSNLPSRAEHDMSAISNNIITDTRENFNPSPSQNYTIGKEIPKNIKASKIDTPETFYNETTAKLRKDELKKEIDNTKVEETKPTYITRAYKNRVWKQNVDDPITRDLRAADTELNSIINEIKKDPSILNDPQNLENFENRLLTKVNGFDDEVQADYFNNLYEAAAKGKDYLNVETDLAKSNAMRASGELKKSGLAQNADLPPELAQGVKDNPPEYQVFHNDDLMLQAQQELANDTEALSHIKDKANDEKTEFSALDFEKSRQMLSKLLEEGKTDDAAKLLEQVTLKGTKAGQAVQAMSLWSRTTPEGALKFAQNLVNKYNNGAKNSVKSLTPEQMRAITEQANKVQQ